MNKTLLFKHIPPYQSECVARERVDGYDETVHCEFQEDVHTVIPQIDVGFCKNIVANFEITMSLQLKMSGV